MIKMKVYLLILALLLLCQGEAVAGSRVRVLGCEANIRHNTAVGALIRNLNLTAGGNFSVCIRFQFARLQRVNIVYHVAGEGTRPFLQLEVNVDNVRTCVKQVYRYNMLDHWLLPHHWYFVCSTYNQELGQVTTYLDGRTIATHNITHTPNERATKVSLAYFSRPKAAAGISFIGNVTQFNLWSRELTPEEIDRLAWCKEEMEGDLISWTDTWEVIGAVQHNVDLVDLCMRRPWRPETQIFPVSNFNDGVGACEALGGSVPVPRSLSHSVKMVNTAIQVYPECDLLWLGLTDEEEEGSWVLHVSGKPVHQIPWAIDEPNGLQYENCAGVEFDGVVDNDCAALRCTTCQLPQDQVLTLRGSCETLSHNSNYLLKHNFGQWVFQGYGDYDILHNGSSWVWWDQTVHQVVAALPPAHHHPVGRHWWQLQRSVCGQKAGTTQQLLLSVCRPGHFTCDDGTCINLNLRCDLKYDCRDNSDESDCLLVRLPPDYKTSVAPRVAGWRYKEGSVGEVRSEVTLTNLRVDTAQMLLKVALNLTLSWLDPRLTYVNLKDDPSLNLVDNNVSEVWRPAVTPLNTVDQPPPSLPRDPLIHVHRHGLQEAGENSLPEELVVYKGNVNPLVEQRGVQASFTCDFNLLRYPFDTQTCHLVFQLATGCSHSQAIKWAGEGSWVKYSGSALLMEYMVGHVTLSHHHTTLRIRLPLARRNGNAVINIYVPSLTMLVVGYLTLFFLKNNFEARVMTSITSLLVMATLFTQVAASLPKTSYFKLVDIWLLFCIDSTFFIIIFHIIIDLLVNEHNKTIRKGDLARKYSAPALFTPSESPFSPRKNVAPLFVRQGLLDVELHDPFNLENQGQGLYLRRGNKGQRPWTAKNNVAPWNAVETNGKMLPSIRISDGDSWEDEDKTSNDEAPADTVEIDEEAFNLWAWLLHKVSVKEVEKFAQVFMMVVFLTFNIIYWIIALSIVP